MTATRNLQKILRWLLVTLILTLTPYMVGAQVMSTRYYEENPPEEYAREITSDTMIFYRPLSGGATIYGSLSEYGFGFVNYSPRGADRNFVSYYMGGVELTPRFDESADYIFLTNLRRVAVEQAYYGRGRQQEQYLIDAAARDNGHSLRLGYYERRYRLGGRLISASTLGPWRYALSIDGRTGRDPHIDGHFGESLGALLALERPMGDRSRLSISLLYSLGMQSVRGWTTDEVVRLTGNPLYNPNWGLFDGRQRSSRIRRSEMPALVVGWKNEGARGGWEINLGVMGGQRSVSGLSWINAMNPSPDHYTLLPSYFADPLDREAVEEVWQSGEERYTQVGWDEFHAINSSSPDGSATYILDSAVESPLHLSLSGIGHHRVDSRTQLSFGARASYDLTHNFERVDDLMGASWTDNLDGFLIDDVEYSDRTANHLAESDRRVREGEIYGYNYFLNRSAVELSGGVEFSEGRLLLLADGMLRSSVVGRRGLYEKATFEGSNSFGRSKRVTTTTYELSTSAAYTLSFGSVLRAGLLYATEEPKVATLFYDPRYSNRLVPDVGPASRMDLSMDYSWSSGDVKIDFGAYYHRLWNLDRVMHYYDDLSSTYCDMVIRDGAQHNMGIEMGLSVALSPRMDLSVAAALGHYRFMNDPLAELRSNVDGELVARDVRLLLDGYTPTSSPERSAAVKLSYSAPWSWWLNAEWYWAGARRVELSPVRRSERVIAAAATPESRRRLIDQRELPAASQLNIFIYRSFELGHNDLALSLSLNNVLNRRDVIYGGYESSRLRKQGTAMARTIAPHADRLSYSTPRTMTATLTYKF